MNKNLQQPIEQQQGEYNMPSIDHNGEAWIRLVDHIELTTRTRRQALEDVLAGLGVDRFGSWNEHKDYMRAQIEELLGKLE